MNARNARAFRKSANEAVRQVAPAVNAALDNEAATRYRVGQLEDDFKRLEKHVGNICADIDARWDRGFWGRLLWLVSGR